jgi:YfiH family protein
MVRPLLVSEPRLVGGKVSGGITTRRGFPAATRAGHDDPAREDGRRLLASLIGLPPGRLAWLEQVHGREAIVTGDGGLAGKADALVTRTAGLALLVAVADCGPVLLFDAKAGVIAAAHAGWRGAVAGVCGATVDAMRDLGADDISAWVGPCIGQKAFEVGEEVAAQFPEECVDRARPRPHVDLAGAIRLSLLDAGLAPRSITLAHQCTFELDERYWSYRRDGGICGRQFAWIVRRD